MFTVEETASLPFCYPRTSPLTRLSSMSFCPTQYQVLLILPPIFQTHPFLLISTATIAVQITPISRLNRYKCPSTLNSSCIVYITDLSDPLDSRQVWPQRSLWKPQRSSEGVQDFSLLVSSLTVAMGQAGHLPLPNVTVPPGVFFSPLLRLRVSTPQLLHVADVFSTVPAHPPFEGNRPPAARLLLVGTRPVPWRLSLGTRFSPHVPHCSFPGRPQGVSGSSGFSSSSSHLQL